VHNIQNFDENIVEIFHIKIAVFLKKIGKVLAKIQKMVYNIYA